MAKRIDVDKAKEEFGNLTISELHKKSLEIAMGILDNNSDNYKSACATNFKLKAINELIKEKKK